MTAQGSGPPLDLRRLAGPGLSVVGLVVIGIASLALLTGDLLIPGRGGDGGPIRTATPSNVVVVDPRARVPGSITYVKAGNVWIQSGAKAFQVTSGGQDSMPSWSPDGTWIYFIRSRPDTGSALIEGVRRQYRLEVQTLMRIAPDGESEPEPLLAGEYERGASHWTYFLRQPMAAPDGRRLAVITDGPTPSESDVVLKFLDLATLKLESAGALKDYLVGHQDPAWSPDGRFILVVRNGRDGSRGAPRLVRYDTTTGKSVNLTGPGYLTPAWSPDGRAIAATRTDALGTDVVILDGHGTEVLRVTGDEHSFAPAWSPAGDALVFLREEHGVVDAWLVAVSSGSAGWTAGTPLQLTFAAGLEAASRPWWFIPADELPTPPPATPPAANPTTEAIASPVAS